MFVPLHACPVRLLEFDLTLNYRKRVSRLFLESTAGKRREKSVNLLNPVLTGTQQLPPPLVPERWVCCLVSTQTGEVGGGANTRVAQSRYCCNVVPGSQ